MGYKLAGFDVLGGVEIDPEMMKVYRTNHNPKHSYLMGVEQFNKIPNDQLPKELFNLDILDGSPPCSSFSMAGSREKAWGEKKKFREGQAEQVLDDLFFHFIDTAKKLQPRIVIAENVKGLILGKAKGYVKQIAQRFNEAGYSVQLFLLNASFMGVPQRRERTFFIATKSSKKLSLNFNEKIISVRESWLDLKDQQGKPLTEIQTKYWIKTRQGDSFAKAHPNDNMFTWVKLSASNPSNTVTAGPAQLHYEEPRWLSKLEHFRLQSFPDDYNLIDIDPRYICGMSVPPFMMQRIAREVYLQLL